MKLSDWLKARNGNIEKVVQRFSVTPQTVCLWQNGAIVSPRNALTVLWIAGIPVERLIFREKVGIKV